MAVSVLNDLYDNLKKNNSSAQKSTSAAKATTTPVSTKKTTTVSSNSGKTTTTTKTSNSLINTIKNFFSGLNQKASASMSNYNPNSGVYTSSAGSYSNNPNTSTYSNVAKQTVKAYDQPFTSSGVNYTTVPKVNVQSTQKAYTEPFTSDAQNVRKVDVVNHALVNLNNKNVQDTLKQAASSMPESKVGKAVASGVTKLANGVTDIYNGVVQKINEKDQAKTNEKLAYVQQKNQQMIDSAKKEDLQQLFDQNGQMVDYSETIQKLKNRKSMLEASLESNPNAKIELDQIKKDLERYDYLDQLRSAIIENTNLQNLDDSEESRSYREQLSHKYDNFLERGQNAINHLVVETANIVPMVLDQAREGGNTQYAMERLDELKQMKDSGSITDEEYKNVLEYWNDYIETSRAMNEDNLSQKIRSVSDQINANTYYGASDIEKFVLQAGESTAQFMLHYVIGKGIAGALTNPAELTMLGSELAAEMGYDAASMSASELMKFGLNKAAGNVSLVTMSTVSGTQKTNQLLSQGVDYNTAVKNGILTGYVSYLTEHLPIENYERVVLGGAGEKVTAHIMNSLFTQSLNEGLEELAEGFLDPLVDSLTMGTKYEVDGTELLSSFLLGATSGAMGGAITGGARTLNIKIGNKMQMNALQSEIDMLNKVIPTMDPEFQMQARSLVQEAQKKISDYRDVHQFIDSYHVETDDVQTTSIREDIDSIYETLTPDFNQEVQENRALDEIQDVIQTEAAATELDEVTRYEKANSDNLIVTDKNDPTYYSYDNLSGLKPRELKTYPQSSASNQTELRKAVWNNLNEEKTISNEVTGDSYVVNSKSITNSKILSHGGYTALQNIADIFSSAIPINRTENIDQNSKRFGNKYTIFYNEFSDGKYKYLARIVTENEAPNNQNFRPNLHKVKSIDIERINTENTEQNKNELYPQAGMTSKGNLTPTFSIDDLVQDINSVKDWRNDLSDDIFGRLNGSEQKVYTGKDTSYQKLASVPDEPDTIENQIRNSMSMKDAQRMLEKAYNASLKDWYDGMTFDQYLNEVGTEDAVNQLAEQILNSADGDLYFQYVVPIEGIMNEDFMLEDVIEAYFNGELKNDTGRKRLGDIEYEEGSQLEKTFYSPKEIEDGRATWAVASQRITDQNRDEVIQARADAVIFAHNNQAPEILGMSQSEINKKIKSWSNYSSKARQISNDLNRNVPREYQWVGLENSNILNRRRITVDQIKEIVKDVYGFADEYNPIEIVDAMLAYDGSINYKELIIEYLKWEDARAMREQRHALGTYDRYETKIDVGFAGDGTVYHEIGHFIDNLWARELSNHVFGSRRNMYLSEMVYDNDTFRNLDFDSESMKTFVSNYKAFIDNLSAKSDIRSDYMMDRKEVFARFCDYFTHWVDKTAGGWGADFSSPYNDNFNIQDCYDFVKLLQQKNALNATVLNNDAQGALWTEYSMDRFLDQKEQTLEDLNDQARREFRNLDLASRRVNLKEDINSAIDDIVYNGEVSEASYNALRQDVIRSTMQQMDNPAWEVARDIRKTLGNNFGTLPRDGWDAIIADINDQYNLFDENYRTYNTYEDAQEFIKDYLNRAGEKYIYMSPVDTGDISEEEYEAKIDQKLDQVITMLKEGVANRINQTAIDNTLADALGLKDDSLYYQEMEDLAYRRGQQDLDALMSEDEKFLKAYEEATAGNYSPEALQQLEDDMVSGITIDQAKEETSVLKEVKKDTSKPIRTLKDIFYQVRQKIFDKGIAIRDLKNSKLSASYDMLLNAENRANYAILKGGYDENRHKVVDSLVEISKMIPEAQKNDFDYYMYHKHNIDAAKIGKPVFFNFDAAKSQQIVNQYEMAHPEWREVAQKYYDFNNYLLKRQVDAGVISQQTADLWKELYPHYVPTKRALEAVDDGSVVETADPQVQSANKGTLYERTGGNSPIQPLDYAMAEHAKQIYKSSLFNNFAKDYVEVSHAAATLFNEDHSFDEDIIEGREEQVTKADEYTPATLIWYNNGDRMIVEIPQQIYDAIGPTQTPFNLPSNVPFLSWASSMRRNMITGANPVFWATNGLKDLQDIAFNSKYSLSTYLNLPRAYKQLLTNGEIANLYKSLGGDYNSYRSEEGIDQNEHGAFYNATIGKVVQFNDLIETAPRLAEFMSSLDHGDSLETAMYNAAEVTTNFKRGGDYAKWLNRNGATFLNASIQGFDKQVRNIADAYDSKGWKGVAGYMVKANLLAGIPLIVINGLLHRDDKDYDQLSDYIKDNYYILWKYDDGKFVRIPKGRIANAYQGILTALYENGVELVGDDKAIDKAKTIWENTLESLKNVWEQVGINDVGGNNIFSPIVQTIKNEAWYGDPIVSTYMQKKNPEDQYDESTDLFSVWLGQKTKLSPKKINYLIDQYSGGVGDVILPMLTTKAETGLDDGTAIGKFTSAIASPFVDKFTTDSVFKNQDVTDFFALDEELTKLANKEHASDEAKLASKYINSLQYQMNDLYAQKRQISNDTSIPDSVKYERTREVQRQIDALARFGLDTYDQIDMDGYYADLNGVSYYRNTKGEWSKVDQDKEAELDALNLTTKEKSDYFYVKNNISELREQVKADTPDGQDADYRAVTLDAIMSSDLTPRVQNLMYDSYYSGKITDNINGMDLTDEEKLALKMANATASSVKDANGKTISNSKALGIADAYADAGLLDDVFSYIAANGLAPSDFGLTKTVYGYSYDKMASEYQKIYGETFGTGSTQNVDLSTINNKTSNSSSSKKTSSSKKKTSSSKSSKSSSTKAQKAAEKARKKQLKALQKAAKALRKNNKNIFDVLNKMTSIQDAEANVKKIMQNAYKG